MSKKEKLAEEAEQALKELAVSEKQTLKVILKCNFKIKGKNGLDSKKPDDKITLPFKEAMELINKAWAIEV